MYFNTLRYPFLLLAIFAIHWLLGGRSLRRQNFILLTASLLLYSLWDWRFVLLLVACAAVDFFVARRIEALPRGAKQRGRWLAVSVLFCLGALLILKYAGFFLDSLWAFLRFLGFRPDTRTLSLVVPVGLSFYTLQIVTHSTAVYRGLMPASRSPVSYLLFASFFPQSAAGPIGRAALLLPQYSQPRTFDPKLAKDGLRQILWGYFKKIVIADNLAPHVTRIFDGYADSGGITILAGIFLFAIQIYCDFSGYSDIAVGSAKMLGINLTRNFAFPYFSRDIAEFWRRWHVSLSSWFRDYVFFPLGGNMGPRPRRIMNFLVTFGLSGLWHGAHWTYLAWGLLHGIYFIPLVLFENFRLHTGTPARGRLIPAPREALAIFATFLLVAVSWVFFRADNVTQALAMLGRIVTVPRGDPTLGALRVALLIPIPVLALEWLQRSRDHGLDIARWPVSLRWGVYLALSIAILLFAYQGTGEFIYAQF